SALVAGLVITAGFAAVAVGTLNLISVSFAVLFIGLSVDFGIHFGLRYREERLKTETNRDALVRAAEGTGAPLGLAALAAAIAFLAFLPTDYIGLAQLGLISGVGMAIALTLNLTVPPAILSLLPGKIPERPEACPMSQDWPEGWPDEPDGPNSPTTSSAACQALSRGLTVRPKMTLLCAGVAGVIALALLPFTRFDFDPLNLKDPGTESVATLMEILGDPGIDPYAIEILADTPDQAASLAEELTALPLVRSVLSLSTLVPQEQDDKLLIVEEMAFALGPGLAGEPGALAPEDPVAALESLQAVLAKAAAAEDRLGPEAAAASQAFLDSMSAFPKDPEAIIALNRALTSGLTALSMALGVAL
ncbi:MAG: MMPL family transporter, partial [Rhodospirillaceae bacterium]